MKIKEISKEIHENNVAKGFWDDKESKNIGELLMLVTSELSEALEADRNGRRCHPGVFLTNTKDVEIGNQYWIQEFRAGIKDTFEDEIADAVIRLFDISEGLGIDLEFHIRQKTEYNKTRPIRHGKKY